MNFSQYLTVFFLTILISLSETISQLCFKSAVEKLNLPVNTFRQMLILSWRMLFVFRVWLGMWLGLAGISLWVVLLGRTDLNFAYSLSSIHYLFIAVGSQFVLKEKLSRQRWMATLIITLGIAIVSLSEIVA